MTKIVNQEKKRVIQIQRSTIDWLAKNVYQCHRSTLRRRIERFKDEVGERFGYHYEIPQVRIILKKLGVPSFIEIVDEYGELFD